MTNAEIKAKVLEGNKLALKKLIEQKKKSNSFLIFYENGKIVRVNARDVKL